MVLWTGFGLSFLIRLSRWLAVVQQKEYRPDRLWLFLQTPEGLADLAHFFPRTSDFTRTGLKRPKVTPRVLVVAAMSVALAIALFLGSWLWMQASLDVMRQALGLLALLVLLVLLVPLLVMVATVPSAVIAWYRTNQELQRARAAFDRRQPLVIGVTGSYGKSSTKHLLAHVLAHRYTVFATPRSFNTRYSVAHSIASLYTDESVAILEYGAYGPGEIAALTEWFPPRMALITGLTKQHLGLFKTLDGIVTAKSELVRAVLGGGSIFYNDDDERVISIVERGLKAHAAADTLQVLAASASPITKHWSAPKLIAQGQLQFSWGSKKIETKLVGLHYYSLLKVVAAAADKLDVPADAIQKAFETFSPPSSFITASLLRGGATLIDDGGTSNPQGFKAAMELVHGLPHQRALLITPGIIDLGDEEQDIHRDLAKRARELFATVLYVGGAGKPAFGAAFGDKLIDDQDLIVDTLTHLQGDTIVLVEGRMPGWLSTLLQRLKQ